MNKKNKTIEITIKNPEHLINLLGRCDENLMLIEKKTGVNISQRGNKIYINGAPNATNETIHLINALLELSKNGEEIEKTDIDYTLSVLRNEEIFEEQNTKLGQARCPVPTLTNIPQISTVENSQSPISNLQSATPEFTIHNSQTEFRLYNKSGQQIKPKTITQQEYIISMQKYPIVFGIGPAGTGKTYLAVAEAVRMLTQKKVSKLVFVRPAVEAGEKLGFLPGDFQQKIDPYLRPIFDSLYDTMDFEKCSRLIERNIIEIAPLAYMRGRTLDNAFVILDEAQNTTIEQMKMFLTRLGKSSRAVITGDVTQIDIPDNKASGLVDALTRLIKIDGLRFIQFTEKDVVRHELVKKIIKAYETL